MVAMGSEGTVGSRIDRRNRISEYRLEQPWVRRSESFDDASIEYMYPRIRDHSQLSDTERDYIKERMAGVRKDWRNIRDNLGDSDDSYDARTRTLDVYGDFAETLLEHNPIPEDLSQADRVMHVMRETKGKSMSLSLIHISEPTRPY